MYDSVKHAAAKKKVLESNKVIDEVEKSYFGHPESAVIPNSNVNESTIIANKVLIN